MTGGAAPHYAGPWLTHADGAALQVARERGLATLEHSFDLGCTRDVVALSDAGWRWRDRTLPWPDALKERAVYVFDDGAFAPLQRFAGSLIKLVPTDWGAPTFEIDGIKMLPTSQVSPWDDAARKVGLVQPRGKRLLDTCGGMGYFAAHALSQGAEDITSFEKNEDVIWLRRHNPWSPDPSRDARLHLQHGDVSKRIADLPDAHYDAALHDPPRFGIAGELYSQVFYDHLARVLKPGGKLFHYTGTPNAKTSGRDVPGEVIKRLVKSGFAAERALDGVFATQRRRGRP